MLKAVEAVKAYQRIPEDYEKTFFSLYDVWRYHAVFDVKLCDTCMNHALTFYFVGSHLRGLFEHLKIVDENVIAVNVHPNCRCELHRITDPAEYLMVTEGLFD